MTTIPVRAGSLTTSAPARGSAWARAVRIEATVEGGVKALLERWSIPVLRVALGLVFLAFGLLKFVPGLSPIEGLVMRTWHSLSFGIVTGYPALAITAAMESLV